MGGGDNGGGLDHVDGFVLMESVGGVGCHRVAWGLEIELLIAMIDFDVGLPEFQKAKRRSCLTKGNNCLTRAQRRI
jgi:hypothetical protein